MLSRKALSCGERRGFLSFVPTGSAQLRRSRCRSASAVIPAEAPVSSRTLPSLRPKPSRRCRVAAVGEVRLGDGHAQEKPLIKHGQVPAAEAPQDWSAFYAKLRRRIVTGVLLGVVVTSWVYSNTFIFSLGMSLFCVLGQLEFLKMVRAKGHHPAMKVGVLSTMLIVLSAQMSAGIANAMLPVMGTIAVCYLLLRRSRQATIADIATTLLSVFYAGYMPSFYVRIHSLNAVGAAATPLGQLATNVLPTLVLPVSGVTSGMILTYWTFLSEVTADVGAFFWGRLLGRTKISVLSPKKTMEGAIGGFACGSSMAMLGAFLMRWPLWYVTGPVFGLIIGVMGLLGDLTASLFKRDAGFKDSGDLLPGHGGILDRTDSYVLVAPLVYFFVVLVLPIVPSVMWSGGL